MIIKEEFYLTVPHEEAWKFLSNFPGPLQFVPGKLEIIELVQNKKYKGLAKARVGPLVFTFSGAMTVILIDHKTYQIHMKAEARDSFLRSGFVAKVYTQTIPFDNNATRVTLNVSVGLNGLLGKLSSYILKPVVRRALSYYETAVSEEIIRLRKREKGG